MKFWKKEGFERSSTGGGYYALFQNYGQCQIMITASEFDGETPTKKSQGHDVGVYNADGEQIEFHTFPNADAALDWMVKQPWYCNYKYEFPA